MGGAVDRVPPNQGCETLDGKLTHKQWDENDTESLLIVMMLKWGGGGGRSLQNAMRGEKFQKVQYDPPTTEERRAVGHVPI